jgi:hypothetical protein
MLEHEGINEIHIFITTSYTNIVITTYYTHISVAHLDKVQ